MMTLALLSAIAGGITSFLLHRLYDAKQEERKYTDAYEEGWSNGYDVGLRAPRPKRAKKITQAES